MAQCQTNNQETVWKISVPRSFDPQTRLVPSTDSITLAKLFGHLSSFVLVRILSSFFIVHTHTHARTHARTHAHTHTHTHTHTHSFLSILSQSFSWKRCFHSNNVAHVLCCPKSVFFSIFCVLVFNSPQTVAKARSGMGGCRCYDKHTYIDSHSIFLHIVMIYVCLFRLFVIAFICFLCASWHSNFP